MEIIIIGLTLFAAGFAWGMAFNTWASAREERARKHRHLNISMPMKPETAADTMRLLERLVRQIEVDQKSAQAAPE